MKIYKQILFVVFLLIISMVLSGCPHSMVKSIEKIEKRNEDIKNKKKLYRSMNKSYSVSKVFADIKSDTNYSENTVIKRDSIPVILDIIHIDDKAYPEKIKLKAIVTDTNGKYIKGLADPYYEGEGSPFDYWIELFDSCKDQNTQIKNYDVKEIRQNIAEPFAIHFVLDHSSSMGEEKCTYLQKIIKSVLFAVKPTDMIAITKFAGEMLHEVEFTNDKDKYINDFKVNGIPLTLEGGTAYYDAMIDAIYSFEQVPDTFKKVIISFTDGQDGQSKANADSVKLLSKKKNVEIYSIAYGYAEPVIKEIAEYSGGRYYFIISSKEFPYVFRDIYLLLNNYYQITYNPPNCESIHKVKVNFTFPELNMEKIFDVGFYDRSMFTPDDPVGTKAIANIEFDYNSDIIKNESKDELSTIADILHRNKDFKLLITGHTDNTGSEEYNMELSLKRANAVRRKLVDMGIDPKRLATRGLGESQPLVPNDTDENKKQNRRTEFMIIR